MSSAPPTPFPSIISWIGLSRIHNDSQSFLPLLKRHYTWLKDFSFKSFPLLGLEHRIFPIPNFHWLPQMFYPFGSTGTSLENCLFHYPPLHLRHPPPPHSQWVQIPAPIWIIYMVKTLTTIFNKYWHYSIRLHFSMPLKCIPNNKCSNFLFIIFVFYSYCSNKIYTQQYDAIFPY